MDKHTSYPVGGFQIDQDLLEIDKKYTSLAKEFFRLRDEVKADTLSKEEAMIKNHKEEALIMTKDINNLSNNTNVIPIIGRKGTNSNPPTGVDWLSKLPVDTVFLTKEINGKNPKVDEFHVIYKGEKAVKVLVNLNEPEVYLWLDPIRFCELYELVEVVNDPDTKQ